MKPTLFNISWNRSRPGAAILILVLVVGAVSILIGATLATRSISFLSMGNADVMSRKVLALADGCAEDVLLQLRNDRQYAGGTFLRSEGTCLVSIAGTQESRLLTITATISRWSHVLLITVNLTTPRIAILDWRTN